MTAVTADNTSNMAAKVAPVDGYIVDFPVAASTTIYKDTFVMLDGTGYLVSYTSPTVGTTKTGGGKFVGIAREHVNNSSGSDGDLTAKVQIDGHFQYALSSAAVADVGTHCFASDNATLTQSCLGNACVGRIVFLDASGVVVVKLQPFNVGPMRRVTAAIAVTALNTVGIIWPEENGTGLIVDFCYALITTAMVGSSEDQGIITVRDTAGSPNTICTLTPSDGGADAIGDFVPGDAVGGALTVGGSAGAALGEAIVSVAAGLGIDAIVSQATAGTPAGAMKVVLQASPIL